MLVELLSSIDLSELEDEGLDRLQLEARTAAVEGLRLNLLSGQQCVRDFFLCLNENLINWPDVFSIFGFKITHSTSCDGCGTVNSHETLQSYVEIEVPPEGSSLSDHAGYFFNTSTLVGLNCRNTCNKLVQVEKRSQLTNVKEANFITVVLARGIRTMDGFKLNTNSFSSSSDLFIR